MNKLTLTGIIAALLSPQAFANGYDCTNLDIWNSTTAYNGGDSVQHLNHAYQANWWSQGNPPDEYSDQWQEWSLLGQCESSEPQPPTIDITSPQDGGQFVLDKSILLAAQVTSQNSEIKEVEFIANGESVAIIQQEP
ncbi:Ig-like domain-containing protein, partial [Photobacterium sanctipauli]